MEDLFNYIKNSQVNESRQIPSDFNMVGLKISDGDRHPMWKMSSIYCKRSILLESEEIREWLNITKTTGPDYDGHSLLDIVELKNDDYILISNGIFDHEKKWIIDSFNEAGVIKHINDQCSNPTAKIKKNTIWKNNKNITLIDVQQYLYIDF